MDNHDGVRALGRLLAGAPPGPGLDWAAVVARAQTSGVASLLFYQLRTGANGMGAAGNGGWTGEPGQFDVPAAVKETLRTDYHAAVAHSMAAQRQLARLLGALAAAEVPALVIKGPAVDACYPQPALRIYGDLDVLVPWAKLEQAEQVVNGLGYRARQSKRWHLETHFHLPPMLAEDGRLAIEIHWRLDDGARIGRLPVEELWARAEPWAVMGQPALRLEGVDAVLHLCRHTVVQHRLQFYLQSACDVACLTGSWGQAEWATLARRAEAYGLERVVYLMLVLMEQALGLAAPREAKAALQATVGAPLPDDLAERLSGIEQGPVADLASVVGGGRDSTAQARVQRVWRALFWNRETMALKHGLPADSRRVWLVYLWRPLELAQQYGLALWNLVRAEPAARARWEHAMWLERWLKGQV